MVRTKNSAHSASAFPSKLNYTLGLRSTLRFLLPTFLCKSLFKKRIQFKVCTRFTVRILYYRGSEEVILLLTKLIFRCYDCSPIYNAVCRQEFFLQKSAPDTQLSDLKSHMLHSRSASFNVRCAKIGEGSKHHYT